MILRLSAECKWTLQFIPLQHPENTWNVCVCVRRGVIRDIFIGYANFIPNHSFHI